jgi:DNA-binding MarR family transcriptional regulator
MKESITGIATFISLLRVQINDFIKEELKDIGNTELVPSYGALLSFLYKNDGKAQISDVYNTLLKQKTTITEMINRLVKLGYIEKEKCTEDKRVTYIVLTEKSLAFQNEFERISNELLSKMLEDFTEEEKNEFFRLILKSIKNFT